jgi:phosphocarrier protein HPr
MSGIETRAIVDINKTANQFKSSVVLRWDGKAIDAKSILGLSLTLIGSQAYHLDIHGPDEAEARAAMLAVFRKHHLPVDAV